MNRVMWFGVGFVGAVVFGLGLRALVDGLNPDPCQGRTLSSLMMPLLLGPGGIFLATRSIRLQDGRTTLGIGVVAASLLVLFLGLRTIGELKGAGCAPEPPKQQQNGTPGPGFGTQDRIGR